MNIDRVFFIFMAVCGVAIGAILVFAPEARNLRIAPYFWVLIAMALFELALFVHRRRKPGPPISIEARLFGLVIAVVLMVVIAGAPTKLF